VLDYYARCARTNNHTVREAACTCIGELADKVARDAVAPSVPRMLRTLIACLRDDSWPVRTRASEGSIIRESTVRGPQTCAGGMRGTQCSDRRLFMLVRTQVDVT